MKGREEVLALIRSAYYSQPTGTAENAWNDACQHIEEGLSRLSDVAQRPADCGAWQDIETAPKDGSYVLISSGNYVDVARWSHGSFGGFDRDDELRWRPLPTPHDRSPPPSTDGQVTMGGTGIDHSDEECPNFPGCHCLNHCLDGWKHPSPEDGPIPPPKSGSEGR